MKCKKCKERDAQIPFELCGNCLFIDIQQAKGNGRSVPVNIKPESMKDKGVKKLVKKVKERAGGDK